MQVVPLSAEAVAALRGAGPSALAKLQQASGAHIALKAGQAAVSGTARAIAEAATLLRTLSRGGEAEEGEVVESVIKEAISSLHSAIL